jgi:hypothetical protein
VNPVILVLHCGQAPSSVILQAHSMQNVCPQLKIFSMWFFMQILQFGNSDGFSSNSLFEVASKLFTFFISVQKTPNCELERFIFFFQIFDFHAQSPDLLRQQVAKVVHSAFFGKSAEFFFGLEIVILTHFSSVLPFSKSVCRFQIMKTRLALERTEFSKHTVSLIARKI